MSFWKILKVVEMNNNFGGIIWTNHALQRLKGRKITQSDAWLTWRRPEKSRYIKEKGSWVFHRTYNNRRIEVIAKKNERKEWIILSVWSKEVTKNPKYESFLSFLLKKIFVKKKGKNK